MEQRVAMNEKEIIQGLKVVCKCKVVNYKKIKEAIINGAFQKQYPTVNCTS